MATPESQTRPAFDWSEWKLPVLLYVATAASTMYAGAFKVHPEPQGLSDWLDGWVFAVPLMAILTAHEFGHYIAARIHRVDASPPYFIPLPLYIGTLGAVIRMRGAIRSRNALLDIGAAGPLAGMVVAIPVLVIGLTNSPVTVLPETGYIKEGHSLLYAALIYVIHGPIADGSDVMLSPTALAGWVGLLVTMINMIPFGQLDGGHVAYSLIGSVQDRISRIVLRTLPILAVSVSVIYGLPSYVRDDPPDTVLGNWLAGQHWLFWALLLWVLSRFADSDHPPTHDAELSPRRRLVAIFTLGLFVLLFMPSWLRIQ